MSVGNSPDPMVGRWKVLDFPVVPDLRGNLAFIEGHRHVPMNIARVFYIYDVPEGAVRGGHAHHRLSQLIVAVAGSLEVTFDNGHSRETITLDNPHRGALMGPMVWQTMNQFQAGSVCLVLASMPYDESDYIRDFSAFRRLVMAYGNSIC